MQKQRSKCLMSFAVSHFHIILFCMYLDRTCVSLYLVLLVNIVLTIITVLYMYLCFFYSWPVDIASKAVCIKRLCHLCIQYMGKICAGYADTDPVKYTCVTILVQHFSVFVTKLHVHV